MIKRLRIGLTVITITLICSAAAADANSSWPWPVSGDVITAYKNGNDPYAAGQHRGIDIAAPLGTAVNSSVSGAVTYAGRLPDGGITATVRSDDGRYLVSFLHMSELSVERGDSIAAGRSVGRVGTTGKRSVQQPHLHFSVRSSGSGNYVDPLPLLATRAAPQAPGTKPPEVAEPLENPAPQAKTNTEARNHERAGRESTRTPQHDATRRSLPKHVTGHSAQPQLVHVPASGDSVSAKTNHVADSARESHKSTDKGRVAHPPMPLERPDAARLATPGRDQAAASSTKTAAAAGNSNRPSYRTALLLLIASSIAAIAIRRRRSGGGGFTPPLAHRADLLPIDQAGGGEVVEFAALHRRA